MKIKAAGVLLILLTIPFSAAAEDFPSIFGTKYAEAETFLGRDSRLARSLGLPPLETRMALAVVFPEVLRFRALEDEIQVRALKVLYVQYGREYANFSIGHFQMKPSFAEQVERDFKRLFPAEGKSRAGGPDFKTEDSAEARADRVRRLDDPAGQALYLRWFMLVMDKMHRNAAFADDRDKLRFFATAYNSGYARAGKEIRQKMNLRTYHIGLIFPERYYNYADVAESYFDRLRDPAK